MSAALAIARVTGRQLLGTKRLIIFGLVALAPAGLFLLGSGTASRSALLDRYMGLTLGLVFILIVPITTLIIAASALGDERRDATLSFLVLRPIPRSLIAASKLAAAFVASFAVTGTAALLLAVAYGMRSGDYGYLVAGVVGAGVATAVYAAVFVPLGYLSTRSTLIGLIYLFVWEQGVAGALGGLATTSPWRLGFAAFLGLAPAEAMDYADPFALGDLAPGAGGSIARAAVFLAVSTAFTAWLLKRRDLA